MVTLLLGWVLTGLTTLLWMIRMDWTGFYAAIRRDRLRAGERGRGLRVSAAVGLLVLILPVMLPRLFWNMGRRWWERVKRENKN